jgi:hypothetical protein
MKYPTRHLTPFPPTFLRIPRTTHTLRALRDSRDERNPNLRALCFHTIADSCLPRASKGASSKKPTPSPSSKSTLFFQNTRSGVSPSDVWTLGGSRRRPPPNLHNFSAPINTFRMNTSISVASKRLHPPLESTLMKKPGEGVSTCSWLVAGASPARSQRCRHP